MLFLSSCTCFQPCMVLHKTTQHRSTCSFIQQFKNTVDILRIGGSARMNYSLALLRLSRFEIWTSQARRFRRWFIFYSNNSYSPKVKPCGRTTQFFGGLHCQARNQRRTELVRGCLAPCLLFLLPLVPVALLSLLEFEFRASITLAPMPLNIPITKDNIVVTN